MKNRVITIFLISFFACLTTTIDANDSVPETMNIRADSINRDSLSVSSAPSAEIETEKKEAAAREKAKQDSIRAANAEIAQRNALRKAQRDSIAAREAEQREAAAREKAKQDSIAANKAKQREVAAIEKAKKDSISAVNAHREKEEAKREAERAKLLLEKVIKYSLVALIFCVVVIVVIIVVSRHRKKKDMDKDQEYKKEDVIDPSTTNPSPLPGAPKEGDDENIPPTHPTETTNRFTKLANWVVVAASVKGNGHIQSNMPCQDNNMFESLSDDWGIAIVSDGAGSAAHSDLGSKIVVTRGIFHFKKLIESEGWVEKKTLPTDIEWLQKSYAVLKDIRTDVMMVAQKNNTDVKSLSATCLVVIYSPYGLLTVHVGDGRMGYKTLNDEWKPMMTPHKGEEANQTIFLVSDFWSIPQYTMSGVLVPESIVVREPVKAFALMSDGCENTAWQCTALNSDTGKYFDRNLPFAGFFNPLEETLLTFSKGNVPVEERQAKWFKFIESGTSGFVKEQDDKTMIYAVNVELMK